MKKTLLIPIFLIFFSSLFSQKNIPDTSALNIDFLLKDTTLNPWTSVFVDTTGQLDIDRVVEQNFEIWTDSFQVTNHQHTLWIKSEIKNTKEEKIDLVIIDQSGANFMDIFILESDSSWTQQKTGTYVPKKERSFKKYHFVGFDFSVEPEQTKTVFIKITQIDHDAPSVNLVLLQRKAWDSMSMESSNIFIFSFVAILSIMFLYSLMVFIATREKMYLYYALYALSIASFIMFAGGGHQLLFYPILNEYMILISLCGLSVFYFQFGRKFLNLSEIVPKWDKILHTYIVFRLLVLVGQLIYLAISFNVSVGITIEFAFFLVDAILSVLLFRPLILSKSKIAWFFISGASIVFVFALSYIAIMIVIRRESPDFDWFFLAIIIEILIFSLGLGYRMKQMEREKLQAKEAELQAKEALIEEQRKINTAFGRFVPEKFLKALDYNGILDVRLGHAKEKEVTVFFSDIRAYTTLSESMTPEENFRFLNAYLGRVGPLINENHGFVNQYYGDGIMALFMDSPADAIKAAISIHREVRAYNTTRKKKGRMPIRLGIGIHSGKLMMGIIGDTLRMEAGVVSDTVNTASRMEGLTKHYGASILVSEFSLRKIENPSQFNYRYLGLVQVKGRKTPMRIYDFFDGESEILIDLRLKTQATFNEGVQYYYAQYFAQAAKAFQTVLRINPTDKTAQLYLHKSTQLILEGSPEDWTGVEMMMSK